MKSKALQPGSVEAFLHQNGPGSSSKVKNWLVESGLTEEAARKRISRTRGRVKRHKLLTLPKREAFLYLEEQFGSYAYQESLLDAHITNGTCYGVATYGVISRGGCIPIAHFSIVSGSPRRLTKHVPEQSVLDRLLESSILQKEYDEQLGPSIVCRLHPSSNRSFKTLDILNETLTNKVAAWVRNVGLGSYNKVKIRTQTEIPIFGQFGWDITAPSYIYPISTNRKTPGFLAIDVIYNHIQKEHAQYFINKCNTTRSLKNMRPFLGILVADSFSEDAFREGKQHGLLFVTTRTLFGTDTDETLKRLTNTLENAAASIVNSPDEIPSLLKSIARIEGSAINLRGALFELIVGFLVYRGEGGYIDIGIVAQTEKGKAEIDIRRSKGNHEIVVYECKGYQPTQEIKLSNVEEWLEKKVPIIHAFERARQRATNLSISFEFWTSGRFSEDAIEFLKQKKKITKKYNIEWKNGNEVLEYARQKNLSSMMKAIKEHFLYHPLSKEK